MCHHGASGTGKLPIATGTESAAVNPQNDVNHGYSPELSEQLNGTGVGPDFERHHSASCIDRHRTQELGQLAHAWIEATMGPASEMVLRLSAGWSGGPKIRLDQCSLPRAKTGAPLVINARAISAATSGQLSCNDADGREHVVRGSTRLGRRTSRRPRGGTDRRRRGRRDLAIGSLDFLA